MLKLLCVWDANYIFIRKASDDDEQNESGKKGKERNKEERYDKWFMNFCVCWKMRSQGKARRQREFRDKTRVSDEKLAHILKVLRRTKMSSFASRLPIQSFMNHDARDDVKVEVKVNKRVNSFLMVV